MRFGSSHTLISSSVARTKFDGLCQFVCELDNKIEMQIDIDKETEYNYEIIKIYELSQKSMVYYNGQIITDSFFMKNATIAHEQSSINNYNLVEIVETQNISNAICTTAEIVPIAEATIYNWSNSN